jgi:hypothetical protein
MEAHQNQTVQGERPRYRDRTAGLVLFGVLEIVIGAFCALMIPLGILAAKVSPGFAGAASGPGSTLPLLAIYAVVSAIMIWLGIGSIRARRWACRLMLSLSWIWLLTGACMVLLTWMVLPGLVRAAGFGVDVPPGIMFAATAVTFSILSLIYVLLPGAFVLFYRSPDVIATCLARDPGPQLTDDCPPRILTLATLWGLAAVSVLVMPAYNWVFPLFGRLLGGGAGVLPWAAVAVVCGILAWGSCRLRPWAWWGGAVATVSAALSTVVTAARVNPDELVRALNLPDEQMRMLASFSWPGQWSVVAMLFVVWGTMLAYLATLRGHFVRL